MCHSLFDAYSVLCTSPTCCCSAGFFGHGGKAKNRTYQLRLPPICAQMQICPHEVHYFTFRFLLTSRLLRLPRHAMPSCNFFFLFYPTALITSFVLLCPSCAQTARAHTHTGTLYVHALSTRCVKKQPRDFSSMRLAGASHSFAHCLSSCRN